MANKSSTVSDSCDIFARAARARPSLLALPCKSPAHDKARRRLLSSFSLQASKIPHEVASMNSFSCVYVSYRQDRFDCMVAEKEGRLTQPEGAFSRLAPLSSSQGLARARHYGIISQTIRPPFNRTERQSSFHHPSNGKWTLTVRFRSKK